MKKVLVVAVILLWPLALSPVYADTINLLSIWEADKNKNDLGGVDEDGNGTIDQGYGACVAPSCQVNTGDLSQITSAEFWQGGVANDHRTPDMENMLAFEGVSLGGLDKTFEASPASTKTLLSSIGFSGYITVKASTSVWLYYVEDMYNDGVSITIGNALDGKLHDISHYAEWGVTQVPLPGAAWFFITGLVGIFGLNSITGRTEVIPITAEALVDFPQQLDDWSGSHDRIDDEVAEKLGFSDYVMLNYKNSDYQHINFYLAYYASQRKGLSPHSPKVCIPGGGWEIADFRRTNVDGIPVNRAIIRKGTQDQIVYYWFEERGVAVANEYLKKWMLFVDALLLNRTDGSLVRVTTPVMGNESIEEADLRAQSFIRLSRIQLSQFLPSHDLEGTN